MLRFSARRLGMRARMLILGAVVIGLAGGPAEARSMSPSGGTASRHFNVPSAGGSIFVSPSFVSPSGRLVGVNPGHFAVTSPRRFVFAFKSGSGRFVGPHRF